MTTYENAPATKMLATHCLACSRALVDALSVNAGMGPDCREKYGYNVDVSPEARAEANKLVHGLAVSKDEPTNAQIVGTIVRLAQLQFVTLASKIAERFVAVEITAVSEDKLAVAFGYSPEAVAALKTVPGRRFDPTTKTWAVPASARAQLWAALKVAFPGQLGIGPKGPFVI